MTTYRTKEGDRLDSICFRFYGNASRYVEAVLAANPRLSNIGPVLPSNIIIELPEFPELNTTEGELRLWS